MADHPLHAPVLAWYAKNARDLPWRDPGCSPWGVLVSEVMLQQTPVARVLPAWERWMDRWPTPNDLAADSVGEAIRAWDRLGYPRRAVRLHEAATAMVERHGGQVPDTHAELLALPGVGGYTAAAVASFVFGQRHAVVDTNVRRVQARAVTGTALPAVSLSVAERDLAERLVPDDAARAVTWAVASMELGALVCVARSPRCGNCPVVGLCAWQLDGAPAYAGPPRRGQRYQGTDRYVRGLLLAALRDADGPLSADDLLAAVPEAAVRDPDGDPHQRDPDGDPNQRQRCLDSLVADGLVEPLVASTLRLPGG